MIKAKEEGQFDFSPEKMKELTQIALKNQITNARDRIIVLRRDLKKVLSLKEKYPHLAIRPNDEGLPSSEYQIWQSIHREGAIRNDLDLVQGQLKDLETKLKSL